MPLVLQTLSDSRQAQADLQKLNASVNNIDNSLKNANQSFANIAKGFAGIVAIGSSLAVYAQLSDKLTNIKTQLKLATETQTEYNIALKQTRMIANETRSELSSVAKLYSKLASSGKEIGVTQGNALKATSIVTKAVATAGATTAEASAAIQQLGQALGSGKLAGDELKSILENASPLAKVIADGMGVSINKLREMGEAGALSSTRVFRAILSQQDAVEERFSKVQVTYSAAFTNLGESLTTLFDTVKETALGSTDGLATVINNLANGIFNFAINFKSSLHKAQTDLLLFVTDAMLYVADLWDVLSNSGEEIERIGNNLREFWSPIFVRMRDSAIEAFDIVAVKAAALGTAIAAVLRRSEIGTAIVDGVSTSISYVGGLLQGLFTTVRSYSVRAMDFFPDLEDAIQTVKNWAKTVERWFFWLYDKVIGHSWIPDLVTGVVAWMSKLTKKPVDAVKSFASTSSRLFSKIKFAAPFSAALTAVMKYRGGLLRLLAVLGAVGAATAAVAFSKSGDVSTKVEQGKQAVEKYQKKSTEYLKQLYLQNKQGINNSVAVRTVKQVLGIKDTTAGAIFGERIDTRAEVGRGPQRNEVERSFGHDFINALPQGWRVPAVAAFAGVFGLAIVKAFEGGPVRTALLGVMTIAASIIATKTIGADEIRNSLSKGANSALEILSKGLTAIFGGNVLKDPFGLLALLAATSLLFAAGRKYFGGMALSAAKAPTTAANALVQGGIERKLLQNSLQKTEKALVAFPRQVKQSEERNRKSFNALVKGVVDNRVSQRTFASAADKTAYERMVRAQALAAIRSGNTTGLSRTEALRIREARLVRGGLQDSISERNRLPQRTEALRGASAETSRRINAINERLTAQKDALRDGTRNFAAGAAGVVGAVAGFQLGTEIAKGMTNSPEWVKLATIMATAFAGQAVGAAIGAGFAATATFIVGRFMAAFALMNPFVRGAIIIGAALYTAYEIFKRLPEDWKKQLFGTQTAAEEAASYANSLGFMAQRGAVRSQEENNQRLKSYVQDQRAAGVGRSIFAPDITSTEGYRNASAFDKEKLRTLANEPTAEERKENLESLKRFTDSMDNFSNWVKEKIGVGSSAVVKRASGGFVRGVGTGTSDSIPAMLSNGEFVVNAKDASKNWQLLSMINGGANVGHFAEGTAVIKTTSGKELSQFGEMFGNNVEKMGGFIERALGITPKPAAAVPETPRPPVPTTKSIGKSTIENQIDSAKTLEGAAVILKDAAASIGGLSVESSKAIAAMPAAAQRNIAGILDRIRLLTDSERNARLGGLKGGALALRAQEEQADKLRMDLKEALAEGGIVSKELRPISSSEGGKSTKLQVGDQLPLINKVFPKLDLSAKALIRLPDEVRENIFAEALKITAATNKLEEQPIGTLEGGTKRVALTDRRNAIEVDRIEAEESAAKMLTSIKTPFERIKSDIDEFGINFSEEAFNALSENGREVLRFSLESLKFDAEALKLDGAALDGESRKKIQESFTSTLRSINEQTKSAAMLGLNSYEKVAATLGEFSVGVEERAYNLMTDLERQTLKGYAAGLKAAPVNANAGEAERIAAQKAQDATIEKALKLANKPLKTDKSKAAGDAMASQTRDAFQNSLTNVLTGDMSLKDAGTAFLDVFTKGVLETFSAGITESLFGGTTESVFKQLGSGIFGLGAGKKEGAGVGAGGATTTEAPASLESIWTGLKESFQNIDFGEMWTSFTGAFKSIDFGALMSGVMDGVQAAMQFIKALFMADGGYVSGPGTGRSDSVPAMLSNGEFVVNAAATKKHGALLSAINSNSLKKFASGGLVTNTSMAKVPSLLVEPKASASSQKKQASQIINLSITGDISRQTKSEILQLLPSIAEGVNMHNREKGYRG